MSATRNHLENSHQGQGDLASWKDRLAAIAFGHALYAGFNWLCDNVLYVYAVYRLGLIKGGLLMTCFAGVQCALTLMLYERMQIDWVGAGSLASIAGTVYPNWWQRIIKWAVGKGNAAMFLALCIFQDAFITTSYFRRGRFDGLSRNDWKVFGGAVLVSNLYWTLRSGAVATALTGTWHLVFNP